MNKYGPCVSLSVLLGLSTLLLQSSAKEIPGASARGDYVAITRSADSMRLNLEDEAAINLYSQALSLKPEYDRALFGRGKSFEALGKYDQAINDFKKCSAYIDERGQTSTRELAGLLTSLHRYNESLAVWNRLIDVQGFNSDGTYSGRGEANLALKKYPEAIADFTAASKAKLRAKVLSRRAVAYFFNKNYAECIADCTHCLAVDKTGSSSVKNNAEVYTLRAQAYDALGKHELASKDRATAKDLDKGNFDIAPFANNKN